VRFDIPLIPIHVGVRLQMDVRWRPPRAFRFSLRAMMIVVGITGILLSFWVWFQAHELRLARANNYHADQAFDPFLTGVVDRPWHAKMYNKYHDELVRNGMIVKTFTLLLLTFFVIAIIGRLMNWLCRRSHRPHQG
jgi:Na+/melibiose symporter-like transporter